MKRRSEGLMGESEDPDQDFTGAGVRDRELHDGQAFGFTVVGLLAWWREERLCVGY
jgi:hypothetical protein